MKTIPLKEAFTKATKGPLAIKGCCIGSDNKRVVGSSAGLVAITGHDSTISSEQDETNRALLTHCFNHFQEVVEALESALDQCDLIHDMGQSEWDSEDAKIFNKARAILAKANQVTLP